MLERALIVLAIPLGIMAVLIGLSLMSDGAKLLGHGIEAIRRLTFFGGMAVMAAGFVVNSGPLFGAGFVMFMLGTFGYLR